MVFLSLVNLIRKSGRDPDLRKQKVLKLTGNYFGRRRNVFSIAIRFLQKALIYTTVGRKIKGKYLFDLRKKRLEAACSEHNIEHYTLTNNLIKAGLHFHARELTDLAIWEPRTFKSLVDIAKTKQILEALPEVKERLKAPDGVITRGML